MQVAFYGGSFHPPHLGHAMVLWLHWCDQVDEVWLAPVYDHPFAKGRGLAPYEHRVAWWRRSLRLGTWCRVRASSRSCRRRATPSTPSRSWRYA